MIYLLAIFELITFLFALYYYKKYQKALKTLNSRGTTKYLRCIKSLHCKEYRKNAFTLGKQYDINYEYSTGVTTVIDNLGQNFPFTVWPRTDGTPLSEYFDVVWK